MIEDELLFVKLIAVISGRSSVAKKKSRRLACAKTVAVCALQVYCKFEQKHRIQLIYSFDNVSDDTACLKKKSHSA